MLNGNPSVEQDASSPVWYVEPCGGEGGQRCQTSHGFPKSVNVGLGFKFRRASKPIRQASAGGLGVEGVGSLEFGVLGLGAWGVRDLGL